VGVFVYKEQEMKKTTMNYYTQMQHPLWQKKRLEVMETHDFKCQTCGSEEDQLNVHHPVYKRGAMIWEYKTHELECLCEKCHKEAHIMDAWIKQELQNAIESHGVCFKSVILGFIQGHCGPPEPECYERAFYKHGYDAGHKSFKVVIKMTDAIEKKQGDRT
jgi:hypothetical protein